MDLLVNEYLDEGITFCMWTSSSIKFFSSCSQFLKLSIDAFRSGTVDRVRGGERLVDEKLETMVRTNEQTNAKDHEKLLEKRERWEEPTNKQVQKIVESYQKETEDDGRWVMRKTNKTNFEIFFPG